MLVSLSSRRAWIEMLMSLYRTCAFAVALLAEGVDRNSNSKEKAWEGKQSLSSRRAWIEILLILLRHLQMATSLSSRRAWIEITLTRYYRVIHSSLSSRRAWIEILMGGNSYRNAPVALLAEGVDRNLIIADAGGQMLSLSSRRAWIEIVFPLESTLPRESPSSRRAWIEIAVPCA